MVDNSIRDNSKNSFLWKKDFILVQEIINGDKNAWNYFIKNYSDHTLSLVLYSWCKKFCRIYLDFSIDCTVEKISKKNFSHNKEECDKGMDLYAFTLEQFQKRLTSYKGLSSLKTYLTSAFKYIRQDFAREKYSRITIPVSLNDLSSEEKEIYKLICQSKSFEDLLEKTEKDKILVTKTYFKIREILKKEGKIWEALEWYFSRNQPDTNLFVVDTETGELKAIDIEIEPQNYELVELKKIFIETWFKLKQENPSIYRLLDLRFKKKLSVKDIFNKYKELFSYESEQQIYQAIDKNILLFFKDIRIKYDEISKNITKEELKNFKDSLEEFFELFED